MKQNEIDKQLRKKEQELEELRRARDKAKYEGELKAFSDGFCESSKVIPLIKENRLNASDMKFLGKTFGDHFGEYVVSLGTTITERQASRARKNENRKARHKAKKDVAMTLPQEAPANDAATEIASVTGGTHAPAETPIAKAVNAASTVAQEASATSAEGIAASPAKGAQATVATQVAQATDATISVAQEVSTTSKKGVTASRAKGVQEPVATQVAQATIVPTPDSTSPRIY